MVMLSRLVLTIIAVLSRQVDGVLIDVMMQRETFIKALFTRNVCVSANLNEAPSEWTQIGPAHHQMSIFLSPGGGGGG